MKNEEIQMNERWYTRARDLDKQMKLARIDKNDRVTMLAHICIEEGLNTRARIRGALGKLGFNMAHVVIRLNKLTGSELGRHEWSCDGNGVYTSLRPA